MVSLVSKGWRLTRLRLGLQPVCCPPSMPTCEAEAILRHQGFAQSQPMCSSRHGVLVSAWHDVLVVEGIDSGLSQRDVYLLELGPSHIFLLVEVPPTPT